MSVAIITLIIAATYLSNKKATSVVKPPIIQEMVFQNNCESFPKQVEHALDEANYCNKDSDCKSISLGCPFGCDNLININEDFDAVQKAVKKYAENCNTCVYRCAAPPTKEEIICKNNKCIDARYEYHSFPTAPTAQEVEDASKLPRDICLCWDGVNETCLPQAACI